MDTTKVCCAVLPATDILSLSLSPDESVLAVTHEGRISCYSTKAISEGDAATAAWEWHIPSGASICQATPFPHTAHSVSGNGHVDIRIGSRVCQNGIIWDHDDVSHAAKLHTYAPLSAFPATSV